MAVDRQEWMGVRRPATSCVAGRSLIQLRSRQQLPRPDADSGGTDGRRIIAGQVDHPLLAPTSTGQGNRARLGRSSIHARIYKDARRSGLGKISLEKTVRSMQVLENNRGNVGILAVTVRDSNQ
jgi:hypothetical protein